MTTTDIAKLRALLAEATPGPWRADGPGDEWSDGEVSVCAGPPGEGWRICDCPPISVHKEDDKPNHADAALIAAAVNALPALLDEVERLRAERDAEGERILARVEVLFEDGNGGAPDTSGCDSADPADHICSMVERALDRVEDERDALRSEVEALRGDGIRERHEAALAALAAARATIESYKVEVEALRRVEEYAKRVIRDRAAGTSHMHFDSLSMELTALAEVRRGR